MDHFINLVSERTSPLDCVGLNGAAAACAIAAISRRLGEPLCLVVDSKKRAEYLAEDLDFFAPGSASLIFPPYNISPYKMISYDNETSAKRISALYRLVAGTPVPFLIAPVEALMQRIIPRREIVDFAELIMTGEMVDRDRLVEKLVSGGYARTVIVEEPGDFSVRGGILDIFSPLYAEPLRIEFFGNMVETMRFFSPTTQKKTEDVAEAVILPAKEAVLEKNQMPRIVARIREQAVESEMPLTRLRRIVDQIQNENGIAGRESLLPLIYRQPETLFDFISEATIPVLIDWEALQGSAREVTERVQGNYAEARKNGRLCVEPERMYLTWEQIQTRVEPRKPVRFKGYQMLSESTRSRDFAPAVQFDTRDNSELQSALKSSRNKNKAIAPLPEWISEKSRAAFSVLIACGSVDRARHLEGLLGAYGIQLPVERQIPDLSRTPGRVVAVAKNVSEGFVWTDQKLAIVTENEIFGARQRRRLPVARKMPSELIAVADLKKGDFVVHSDHGIGRYEGLVKLKLNGASNDFLLIEYRGEDKLYLPVDRMNTVQKYLGVEGYTPVLDKMGGTSWSKVKARVKRSAEKIAGTLLELYAARKVSEGFAFEWIDEELQEFEAGFKYSETEDQTHAIRSVLNDMSQPTPMDRLICGDVGYGKTEVALRAAFVAAQNGKQTAVLVPTTVLAEQHFSTFAERFKGFPVHVACLSRFRSTGEQRKILNGLKDGKVDIVIGTHRLFSKDVAFKDLGLLVLDEEQRFGVKHKEKLKSLRRNVDVLALTATPIPRTLHLSLMGVRDVSIISTPPEFRQAIVTYISEYDESVITEAIGNEMRRQGQIFFIHNNIESIDRLAEKLGRMLPGVRLGVAHGRMGEDQLERVMLQFLNKEIDMLVCTTIVESGLDIPAANTILINRADRFGLAQMYQLRGRVGRSEDQAYAYLFIPHQSLLSKDAQKRLKVLMEYSDLGSGFQIALSDLRIRGGGTILGAAQSGHIAAVGYEMFLDLMEHAIAELKGEPVAEALVPEINIDLSAFIPESYIADIDQRLSAYRRLSRVKDLREITDLKEEIIDRYGPMPEEVGNLMLKIMLKVVAVRAGVKRLDLGGSILALSFSEAHQQNPSALVDLIMEQPTKYSMSPDNILRVRLSGRDLARRMGQAKNILKQISLHVNN